jgi:hypothetical protein
MRNLEFYSTTVAVYGSVCTQISSETAQKHQYRIGGGCDCREAGPLWGAGHVGNLEGKVALIIGASRGQGWAHALQLARQGAGIIAMDICEDIPGNTYPLATPAVDAGASLPRPPAVGAWRPRTAYQFLSYEKFDDGVVVRISLDRPEKKLAPQRRVVGGVGSNV